MKRRLFLTAVLPAVLLVIGRAVQPARAQEVAIRDSEAASYVGKTVTVEGTVASVHVAHSGITFLNFGAAYPNQTFTAVIFQPASKQFPDVKQWEGRRVRVTGKVQLYRSKPEIVLAAPSQLVVAP